MLCCVPLFIKFGFWQYHKAEQERTLQSMYDGALSAEPVNLPLALLAEDDLADLRYRHVRVQGNYETQYQLLLDNQLNQSERVGYHVITPLRINNSTQYILVDRGWVPADPDRSILPELDTPLENSEITGHLWLPPIRFYSLESEAERADTQWKTVWQNMDMQKYQQSVPFPVLPMVIRLDAKSVAGGYDRQWPRPAARITTHISYAYQWFGFAVSAVLIWLVTGCKRQDK